MSASSVATIKAEPNWCNRCRHRTALAPWAAALVGDYNKLCEEAEDLRSALDEAPLPEEREAADALAEAVAYWNEQAMHDTLRAYRRARGQQ